MPVGESTMWDDIMRKPLLFGRIVLPSEHP